MIPSGLRKALMPPSDPSGRIAPNTVSAESVSRISASDFCAKLSADETKASG
ncbi:hypothetical protein D3C87_2204460 [compost metagenome]